MAAKYKEVGETGFILIVPAESDIIVSVMLAATSVITLKIICLLFYDYD